MKKTIKGDCPTDLIDFVQSHPNATWQNFRELNQGVSYKELRLKTVTDQGGLCAYCETDYAENLEAFGIEHFHPKSDTSNPEKNWALDWNNLITVCRGGRESDKSIYPTPENLSCDAYKDHLVTKGIMTEQSEGQLFNPLRMPSTKLYKLNKSNGALEVDEQACISIKCTGGHADFVGLAKQTLKVLNLNCQRLCDMRLEVLKSYNQLIKKAREIDNRAIHQQLAERWFNKTWPSFFTTRRDLLGRAAEKYLQSINYDG